MGIKMPRFVDFWTTSTIKDEKSGAKFHYIKTVSSKVVAQSIVFRVVSIYWQGDDPFPLKSCLQVTCLSCQWYPIGDVRTHYSRTDSRRIFKLGGGVDHVTHHVWPLIKVKRSKVNMVDIQLMQCKSQQKTSSYRRNSVPYKEIGIKESNDDVRTLTGSS